MESANTTDSSFIRWVPSRRRQPRPITSGSPSPYGTCRALTNSPASTAAIGLPPAAMIPTNSSSEAPAMTSTANSIGTQTGSPEVTALEP